MTNRVLLSSIVFDAGTQIRASINEQVVSDYAERMSEGDEFPPVVLFNDGNANYLGDGFHRLMAAQRLSFRDINADIRAGTKDDAVWFALGANRQHSKNGLRLSHADKRRAAELAVQTWPHRSAGMIAEQIGVHQTFVSDIKRRLTSSQHDLPKEVMGRDGKTYPSSAIGRVSAERVAEVEQRLRAGEGPTAIGSALKMSTRTIDKIRQNAEIPLRLDKTRDGIRERRERMRAMASDGYSSRQIAAEIGLSEQGCRDILRKEGIDVQADKATRGTHRHDSNRIVDRIVMDAANLIEGVNLIEFGDLDRSRIAEWLKSLQESRDNLGAFIRRLMKEQQKHGEAA